MIIALIILGVSLLLSIYNNKNYFFENKKLREENTNLKLKLEKSEKEVDEIISIDPGDKAIITNYGLVYKDKDIHFSVDYEVEIIEVSSNKVKVNALDFTSDDKDGKDPQNRSGIIAFLQNKWVDKNRIELIVDDATRRDAKLKQLGI